MGCHLPEPYSSHFPEVVRYSSRQTVLEFRLQVDYQAFKQTSEPGRITLLLNCLRRSIDLMKHLSVSESDRNRLLKIVETVDAIYGENGNGVIAPR